MTRTNTDFVWLSPAVRALFRTTTAADGSFVLKGIPQGGRDRCDASRPRSSARRRSRGRRPRRWPSPWTADWGGSGAGSGRPMDAASIARSPSH